jgi:hypothetical protein
MKKLYIFLIFLTLASASFSQTKKELEFELKSTKAKLDSFQTLYFQQQSQYQQKIVYLESIIDKVKFVLANTSPTNNPINNLVGQIDGKSKSDSSQSKNNQSNQSSPIKLGPGDGLTPKTGGTIYTGSRGGQYYINKNGNKTYIKRKN